MSILRLPISFCIVSGASAIVSDGNSAKNLKDIPILRACKTTSQMILSLTEMMIQ